MHELPWITFWGHEWGDLPAIFTSDEVTSQSNRIMSDPKIVIRGNECIILFLTHYLMSCTHNFTKKNYRSLISPYFAIVSKDGLFWLSIVTSPQLICDVTRNCEVISWGKGDLHRWITAVNIDFAPSVSRLSVKERQIITDVIPDTTNQITLFLSSLVPKLTLSHRCKMIKAITHTDSLNDNTWKTYHHRRVNSLTPMPWW